MSSLKGEKFALVFVITGNILSGYQSWKQSERMTVTWKKICEGEKRCAMEFRKPQIPPQSMSWNLPGKKTGLHKAKGTIC